MEKRIAHYPLSEVKALVAADRVKSTKSALQGAALLGLTFVDMKAIVEALESADFYKSMTSHADFTVWQDVYHFPAEVAIYVKLSVVEHILIVSFKEL